jgi:hypothetical protein
MAEVIACALCNYRADVSEADPDASVDDAVQHVARVHGGDELLRDPKIIFLEGAPDDHQ